MIFRNKIRHHKPGDKKWMLRSWESDEGYGKEFLIDVSNAPSTLSAIADYFTTTAGYILLFNRDKKRFLELIRQVHLSRTWHWKGMFDKGPHHIILPACAPFQAELMRANITSTLSGYLEAVYLTIILRDQSAMDVYRAVPFEPLRTRMGSDHQPFLHHWMNFLKIVGTDSPDIRSEFEMAYSLSAPTDDLTTLRKEWLTDVFRPFVYLWQPILDNNPDEFNRVLRIQQKRWKAFYSVRVDRRRDEISGFYCVPALAAVCHAHDLGFPITVKSDYLPKFLVKGDFPRLEWPNPEWIYK